MGSSELRRPSDQSMVDAKLDNVSRLAGIIDRKAPNAPTVAYTQKDGSVTVFAWAPIQKMMLGLQAELVGMGATQEEVEDAITAGTEQQVAGLKFNDPKPIPLKP